MGGSQFQKCLDQKVKVHNGILSLYIIWLKQTNFVYVTTMIDYVELVNCQYYIK